MKNYLIITIACCLFFVSCDDIPDEVINSNSSSYSIAAIQTINSFTFSEDDSSFVASIELNNSELINQVWMDVVSKDGSEKIIENSLMTDDGNIENTGDQVAGDGFYSGIITLSREISSGQYEIQYFIRDNFNDTDNNVRKAAVQTFTYDNGQTKYAPVIANLNMPDTIAIGVNFVFTVDASDQNGLEDIDEVYFDAFRPDNSTLGRILMNDNGDTNFGDQIAGDGIYSFRNSFAETAQTGTWRFVFQAKDKSGLLSNSITHNIEVR